MAWSCSMRGHGGLLMRHVRQCYLTKWKNLFQILLRRWMGNRLADPAASVVGVFNLQVNSNSGIVSEPANKERCIFMNSKSYGIVMYTRYKQILVIHDLIFLTLTSNFITVSTHRYCSWKHIENMTQCTTLLKSWPFRNRGGCYYTTIMQGTENIPISPTSVNPILEFFQSLEPLIVSLTHGELIFSQFHCSRYWDEIVKCKIWNV